jgi:hypothetical protein
VIHVYDSVAVDPLELLFFQPIFKRTQRLSGQQALLGGHDPDQLPFRLERENLGRIEKEILPAIPPDNLPSGN